MTTHPNIPLTFSPEVAQALADQAPIVALESTVITHGLPYPQNVQTALQMEAAVRQEGAIPATIAIIAGEIFIGLTTPQIEFLGQQPRTAVRKSSRRDLPLVLAQKTHGSTTVAGTMILAHRAGIELFATGGIGGVHRGHPFDVSADLIELGRTPVTVICSGAKSILDLPLTCEVLETQGVPIIGYQTDTLPAFFAHSSGLPITARVDAPTQAAHIIAARRALNLQSGTLITVPVPANQALDTAVVEPAIQQATREADQQNIHGAEATPWLLSRLVELTNGQTMKANVTLLQNNGRIAAQIATALNTHPH